jgi:hypothetical protein
MLNARRDQFMVSPASSIRRFALSLPKKQNAQCEMQNLRSAFCIGRLACKELL